jgi:hypothetical protein
MLMAHRKEFGHQFDLEHRHDRSKGNTTLRPRKVTAHALTRDRETEATAVPGWFSGIRRDSLIKLPRTQRKCASSTKKESATP